MTKTTTLSKARLVAALGSTALCATAALALPRFADWAPPVSIEALPASSTAINTAAIDGCASLSRDGLTLFFNSNRSGNFDIFVATRASRDEGFGEPQRLPAPINTSANESCPTFTQDHRLFFSSDREDSAYDIYAARWQAGEWTDPVNLGGNINRPGWLDETPTFYEDEQGREVMIFSSRLPGGSQGKIYQSVEFGPATLVEGGVNSAGSDNRPSITHDGLTLFFDSTRSGGAGGPDLHVASRTSVSEPFGPATNLRSLNSPGFDARPWVSWDGRELIYASIRGTGEGGPDILWTSRDKKAPGAKEVIF
ncbi:PD40 domain-containing protein [Qipengyuania soli]|uniref:PD40 domain-containing protein n=1 Tax=Qipengyuania soli TaxID=2782568 RepID=A0A7S8F4I0_9SPHN|nr:PD40 domain-containing protein [Qipengyuania soli]QPC99044.1 PD40 domain-containing protein [Qipengyuania soli]